MNDLTKIDGAVVLDDMGICYAIGVIVNDAHVRILIQVEV